MDAMTFFGVNLIKLDFTARFARGAKDTEGENFSFAAETPAKRKTLSPVVHL